MSESIPFPDVCPDVDHLSSKYRFAINVWRYLYRFMGNRPSGVVRGKETYNVTKEEFMTYIADMNRYCRENVNETGEYLVFALNKDSSSGLFWKNDIQILCCSMLKREDGRHVKKCKFLNFFEFMNAYQLRKSNTEPKSVDAMTTSTYIFNQTADIDGQCCICMENPNEVLLPCLHSFCLRCISNEQEYRPQFRCPVCKTGIENPIEDSWEVPDIPQPGELNDYLSKLSN